MTNKTPYLQLGPRLGVYLLLNIDVTTGSFGILISHGKCGLSYRSPYTDLFPEVPESLARWRFFRPMDGGHNTIREVFELGYGYRSCEKDFLRTAQILSRIPDLSEKDFAIPDNLAAMIQRRHYELVSEYDRDFNLAGLSQFTTEALRLIL